MKFLRLISILLLLALPVSAWAQSGTSFAVPPDDTAYDATTWDGSQRAATKNVIRDFVEGEIADTYVKKSGDTITGPLIFDGEDETLLDLRPEGSTTKKVIHIVPADALGAVNWDAIKIDADALDPSVSGAVVYGIHIDLSGVAQNNDPELRGIYITQPTTYSGEEGRAAFRATGDGKSVSMLGREGYALRAVGGIHNDYDADDEEGATYTVNDVVIDASSLATTSDIHGYQVSLANGAPDGEVAALATFSNIDPIHQHIGTFASPGANLACRLTSGPTYTDLIDTKTIFVASDDAILIGHASATFNQIKLDFSTLASKDAFIEWYYYSSSGSTFVEFFPNDTSIDGGRQDGVVFWDSSDIPNWTTHDPDAGGAVTTTGYWIKAVRTRVSDPGSIVLLTGELLASTDYSWNKDGDLKVRKIAGERDFVFVTEDTVLTAAQCLGHIIIITGAYTVTLPAVSGFDNSDGGSALIYSTGADTIHVDVNASDRIVLDGTALDDGDKITSPGTAGAFVSLVNDTSAGWRTLGRFGIFVDGG